MLEVQDPMQVAGSLALVQVGARGPRGCPRRPGARRWRAGIAWRPRVSFTVLGLVGELVGEAWQMPRRRRSGRCLRVDRCENPV